MGRSHVHPLHNGHRRFPRRLDLVMSSSFTVYIVRRIKEVPEQTLGVFGSANNAFLRAIEHLQKNGATAEHCLKLHSDSNLRSRCRAGETILLKSDILIADTEVEIMIEKCEVK